ncbi:uncharacterized protein TEOVI_000264600 [Trypanosoma equiperdum]|uniref:Uncharacterized protein n=1 Tax=Trypanosoma equiperdum TaxID=5694 RepID=A0A1G4IFW2_TRYEQ|nr:hypothetical protein, conserved [Trypanosoma equiperdum]
MMKTPHYRAPAVFRMTLLVCTPSSLHMSGYFPLALKPLSISFSYAHTHQNHTCRRRRREAGPRRFGSWCWGGPGILDSGTVSPRCGSSVLLIFQLCLQSGGRTRSSSTKDTALIGKLGNRVRFTFAS